MNNNNKQKINRETIEEIYELNLKSTRESICNGVNPFGYITIVDIALNPNTPKEVLSFLSNHEREVVRASVALNPNTPIDILEKLKDEFPYYIVENPTTPTNTLKEYVEKRITEKKDFSKLNEIDKLIRAPSEIAGLSNEAKVMQIDPLGRIARGIARNPNAPKDLLEKLANDPLYYIRRDVALNPNTPKHVLTYLRNDSNKIVSIYASERTDIPDDFFEEITTTHPYTAATHPNTPSNFLEKLADKYPYEVAAHPNTTAHVLRALPDNYLDVVASNPNTPSDFLEELADKYPYEVAANPSTPGDLLKRLFKKAPYQVAANPNTPIDLLEQLITHPDFLVRKFLAKNPKMSGELLKRLYESKTKNVLCNYIKEDEETLLNELATNPNTPGEVLNKIVEEIEKISQTSNLQKITTDEEEIIRMAATKVLNLPKAPKESTPKRRTKKKPQ